MQFTEVCYYSSVPVEINWLRGLQGFTLCYLSSTGSVKKTASFWNQSVQYNHALWSVFCPHHHPRWLQASLWDYLSGMQSPRYIIFKVTLWECGKAAGFFPYRRGTGLKEYLDQAKSSQLWSSKLVIVWLWTQYLESGTQASHSSPEECSVSEGGNHNCLVC